jgi:hypothetical protein
MNITYVSSFSDVDPLAAAAEGSDKNQGSGSFQPPDILRINLEKSKNKVEQTLENNSSYGLPLFAKNSVPNILEAIPNSTYHSTPAVLSVANDLYKQKMIGIYFIL